MGKGYHRNVFVSAVIVMNGRIFADLAKAMSKHTIS